MLAIKYIQEIEKNMIPNIYIESNNVIMVCKMTKIQTFKIKIMIDY